jgi:tetratricopeptide (TPR) repeat protein
MPKRHWTYVDDPVALGARLKAAREEAGLSQRQLAFPGCSAVYISRIERGERIPSLQLLRELAKRLATSEEFLISGTAPEAGDPLLEAEVALRLDQVELAEHLYAQALEGARDDVTRGRALGGLAQLAFRAGDVEEAIEPLREAHRLLGNQVIDYPAIAETLGMAYMMRSEFESAIAVFEGALADAREREDEHEESRFQLLLANTLIDGGNLARAEEVLGTAIMQAEDATNPVLRAKLFWSQSRLHSARKNHAAASRYARKALAAIELTEHTYFAARAYQLLAYIELERDNAEEALRLVRDGLPLVRQAGNPHEEAVFRLEEARALTKLGQYDEAVELAMELAPALQSSDRGDAGRCYAVLAEAYEGKDEAERALELYELAAEHLSDRSGTYLRGVYSKMAQLLEQEGRKDEALDVLKKALQLDVERARTSSP